MLSTDDFGRDLGSVQQLQRKHDGVERDLAALEDKVIDLPQLSHFAVRLPTFPPSLPLVKVRILNDDISVGGHTLWRSRQTERNSP